jgi:hypothetical protein
MLDKNVKMIGILPGRGRQIPEEPKRRRVPKVSKSDPPTTAPKPRVAVSRKPKPLPKVLWTPVPVPPSFTLDLALPRIAIREFALRFGKVLDMSRTQLEELEEIGGRRSHEVDDDDDDLEQDIDVEMGWVGETSLRALLLGLLSLLLNSQPESGEKREKKSIQDAIQDIKASRANLSRIWSALAAMRAEFRKVDNKPIFPDPLPPPQHTKIHTTRSGALNGAGVNVTSTGQLVPVILPLIEMVLNAQAIRDEFEEGVKEAKERIKQERERTKAMREQWEGMKKTNNPVRFHFFGPEYLDWDLSVHLAGQGGPNGVQTKLERSRPGATCYFTRVCPTLCATGHRPRGPHILCAHTQRGRARGGNGAPGW